VEGRGEGTCEIACAAEQNTGKTVILLTSREERHLSRRELGKSFPDGVRKKTIFAEVTIATPGKTCPCMVNRKEGEMVLEKEDTVEDV